MTDAKATGLEVGTKVYYTGDMANHEGYGHITEITPATQYGPATAVITEDAEDNRVWRFSLRHIGTTYNGAYNPRFVTAEAVETYRTAQMAAWQKVRLAR